MKPHHWTLLAMVSLLVIVATSLAIRPDPEGVPPGSESCREVFGELKVMQAELVRMDRHLESLVMQMHGATDADRIKAMQAVIETLADQRIAVRETMKGTHQKMVVHLMRHLMASESDSPRAAFGDCVIMKEMIVESAASGLSAETGEMEY